MTAAPSPAVGDVVPPAPRFSRRSWPARHKFATFVITLVTASLVLRLIWGWYAGRQLAAALDEIRSRGEPTAAHEIAFESLHASENAWSGFALAIASLRGGADSPRQSNFEYPPYPPHGDRWEQLAAASEKAHGPVFAAARRSRGLARAQIPLLDWNSTRRLANTLGDGAQYAHLRGDDAEAVERLLDTVHLARSVRQDPRLYSQLTGIGIGAVASDAAQQIVPRVKLDPAAGDTPATPAQLRALVAALLDEKSMRGGTLGALRHERVMMLDALRQRADGTWAVRPLADRTALRWLADFDALLHAARHEHAGPARQLHEEAKARVSRFVTSGGLPPNRDLTPRYSRWFEQDDPLALNRFLEQSYRVAAEQRATALIVAARLYRHDRGRWPEDAAALVPHYLGDLPADPFRADGKPIGYVLLRGALPDGGDRPMVYFELGEGGEELIDTEPMYSWQIDRRRKIGDPRKDIRQYRDVSYWLPKTRRFDEEQKRIQEEQKRQLEEQKQFEEQQQRMWKELYGLEEAVDDDPAEPDAPGDDAQKDDAADGPAEQ